MVCKWLGSIASLIAGAGLALGQVSQPTTAPPLVPAPVGDVKQTSNVKPVSDSVAPPAVGVVAPSFQNPTNEWASPMKGSVFLTQPAVDQSRLWFQSEYVLWWLRPSSLPIIVGTAPTNQVSTGTLPSGSITPLFGGASNSIDYHGQSGIRLSGGAWLDRSQDWGVDASYFQLEQKSTGASFASPGDPVIGPVFFDPNTGGRTMLLTSLPNFATGPLASGPRSGTVNVDASNNLWSVEANIRKQICAVFFADHLDMFVGFRYLQFDEGLGVVTDSNTLPGNVSPSTIHIEDHLGVRNQFYGPQIGLSSHTQCGRWSFDATGKLAMGDMHEVDTISGFTQIASPTFNVATNTGVLAEPTNIGHSTHERFAVVPEATFNIGYQVIENVRLTAGYNFLYINNLMRAGELPDGVDARQVRALSAFDPTALVTHPVVQQQDSRFWAQGLNFGVEVRY